MDLSKKPPLDLAIIYDCPGMIKAIQSALVRSKSATQVVSCDPTLAVELAFRKKMSLSERMVPEDVLHSLLENPSHHLNLFDPDDIAWIWDNGGHVLDIGPNAAYTSLVHSIARQGQTEMMEAIRDAVVFYDKPDAVRGLLQTSEATQLFPENFPLVLHAACERGFPNLEMLEFLFEDCGVNINAHELVSPEPYPKVGDLVNGATVLHVLSNARFWWQLDAIRYLAEKGADINAKNKIGETPLNVAVAGCKNEREVRPIRISMHLGTPWNIACVQLLLKFAADPNSIDNSHRSCLCKASNSPEAIKLLLEHGADLTAGKVSLLFFAIQEQNLESVRIILDNNGNPNAVDTEQAFEVHHTVVNQLRYALFCAAFPAHGIYHIGCSAPLVKLLIERGADLYAPLNAEETLLHYVFEHAEYEIVCAFLARPDKINFNSTDQLGRTVLLAACDWTQCLPGQRHKNWELRPPGPVIQILDLMVDITAVDNAGQTFLHHLLNNPDIEHDTILQVLKRDEAKSHIHSKDSMSFVPLHCAFRLLRPEVCESLILLGANLVEPDPTGLSAVHHIATQYLETREPRKGAILERDHEEKYYTGALRRWQKYLDIHGDVNVRDANGNPPLFAYLASPQDDLHAQTARYCHIDNFDKFFRDADVHARNAERESALHVIARRETDRSKKHDRLLFEFMVSKGLDPLAEDDKGRSALDVAAACEKKEILKLFRYRQ